MTFAPRNPPITSPPIRLAVAASGGGTTLQNLIDQIADGRLVAEIVHVIANKPGIGAIERAAKAGILVSLIERKGKSLNTFSRLIFSAIRQAGADLVVLGGFLALVEIPDDYAGRVINIHPSLIPAFCGHGFHGQAVHEAALAAGVKVSGCTVHFADQTFDTGPIILQKPVPVHAADTPTSLAARVFEAECQALPEAIALYAQGKLHVKGRIVHVRMDAGPDGNA
jgi:phosphoribosylglycinamide formyltransferase-1